MGKTLQELKVQLDEQSAALDTHIAALESVNTNVTGIASDVTFLKQKIAELSSGGSTPELIAELEAAANGLGEKVTTLGNTINDIGATTAALDQETDPNAGQ